MDYWATSKAREEAVPPPSRSPSPLPADGARRRHPTDAARGRRRLDLDAGGRPRALIDAEGVALAFEHDGAGSLRRVSSGDWFVAIDGPAAGRTFAASDPAGRTEMALTEGGSVRTLTRGGDRVSIAFDALERVRRVVLPGSINALAYDWDEDGGCVIRAEGGGPLLALSIAGGSRRIALDDTAWIEEEVAPTRLKLRAAVGGAVCDTLDIRIENFAAIAERRWSDGSGDRFARDERGRLASWTRFDSEGNAEARHWRYQGANLVEDGHGLRTLGEGGRVLALERPGGERIAYRYDAAGRRVARAGAEGETRYHYDPLGTLAGVEAPDGTVTRFETDGMGRRVAAHRAGGTRHEHRDEVGRLWAVTDAAGRALHVYVWIGDRIAARIDGAIGAPVAEAYLCDVLGTPNGVLVASGENWRFARLDAPPFGRTDDPARPTLYSHFGDPETGLIHFGARDLDPALGLFVTPDPWHGGEDDPRRWGGGSVAPLERELPEDGAHDYALCRFDPLGRYDRDGHLSGGEAFLHGVRYVLMCTWGFPLTAVSVYFFEPFNLYMEIVGLIVWAIKQGCEDKSYPFGNNTIAKAAWGLASKRQAAFALGLNGFLPRVVTGGFELKGDRAVTIGNVIWISTVDLDSIGRAEVVEVDDIGGNAVDPLTAFNDDKLKRSVVALLSTAKDNHQHLHVSLWTRGQGNAVAMRLGAQAFGDKPGGHVTGALHLRHPVPVAMPVPRTANAAEKLEVHEFVRVAADPQTRLETVADIWFSLKLPKDTGFVAENWLRISAPKADPKVAPAFLRIREVLPAADHAALILNAELPARFKGAGLSSGLKIEAVEPVAGDTPSAGWTGGATLSLPAPAGAAPDFAAGSVVRIEAKAAAAAPPLAGVAAGAPETVSFAEVSAVRVTLTLAPDAGGAAKDAKLRRMIESGAKLPGVIAKKGERGKIVLSPPFPAIAKGDLLVVGVDKALAADPVFVRAKDAPSGGVLAIEPALPEAMVPADAAKVDVRLTKPSGSEDDTATATANPGGADVEVGMPRTGIFEVGNLVRIETAGASSLRRVAAVANFGVDLSDAPVGAGPYSLTRAKLIPDKVRKDVELAPPGRFLKRIGAPAAFGTWPGKLLAIELDLFGAQGAENAAHYVHWDANGRPGGFDPDFHHVWTSVTQGADEYIVLESPLPIVRRKGETYWHVEPDDHRASSEVWIVPVPAKLTLLASEYGASGAVRADKDGRRVLACEPEALVPDAPRVHDTHRRALIEHELNHTVQCNFWGPLMGALPLQQLIMTVADIVAGAGTDPGWLHQVERDANGNPPATADGRIPNNTELNPFEVFSIGGILQLSWKYAFLSPFLASPDLRDSITKLDFEDFNKVFNPLSRLVANALPQVDPHAKPGTRWLEVLGQVLSRALDLRSWTPFIGFVPTLLPDGPLSFLEQGASRASGNLYSVLLTANDRYNLRTRGRLFGSSLNLSGNVHSGTGRPLRLMLYGAPRADRVFEADGADVPGKTVKYRKQSDHYDPFTITLADRGATALFLDDLFDVQRPAGAGAPAKLKIEGPPPLRTPTDFVTALTGDTVIPKLRALVPLPPRVNRTLGLYLLPGAPGRFTIDTPRPLELDAEIKIGGTIGAGDNIKLTATSPSLTGSPVTTAAIVAAPGDDAEKLAVNVAKEVNRTGALAAARLVASVNGATVQIYAPRAQEPRVEWTALTTGGLTAKIAFGKAAEADCYTESVTVTIADEVKLDGEAIAWTLPIPVPAAPPPPPPPVPPVPALKRYQVESCELRIRLPDGTASGDFADAGIGDYILDISDPTIVTEKLPGDLGWKLAMPKALPAAPARLRLFRVIKKADPAFDLVFPDVPTLKDVNSYLEADTFVVVRDVLLGVEALPTLTDQACPWNMAFELKLPIKLLGKASAIIVKRPPGSTIELKPVRVGDDGRGEKWTIGPLPEAIGEDVVFEINVAFGPVGSSIDQPFKLTFKPAIKVIGATYDLIPGTPIDLDVSEGNGSYTISFDPPLPGLGAVQTPGKARLLASAAPEAVTDVKVIVTDTSTPQKMGLRHISVSNMPPLLLPNDSNEYFNYVRPATRGLATPLINGRSSGGAGPNTDLNEPLDGMENAIKALGAGDSVYLSSWFFGPATKLTAGGLPGVTDWGQLLAKKASEDVKIRLLINDFDPVSGLDQWMLRDDLVPLNAIIAALPAGKRDNLKYVSCMHPAHVGPFKGLFSAKSFRNVYVASHHQKFMVVRKGTDLTVFCGGVDIERLKSNATWDDVRYVGWHDIHLRLEGPITRDLEREFVERWNRTKPGSRPAQPGWAAFEDLAVTPLSPADDAPAKKVHLLQMNRTISDNAITGPYTTERDDIKQTYRRAIQAAKQYLYLENQYFKSTDLADWIVAAGKANPALVVIMVVIGQGEDGENTLTRHGDHIQFLTFDRIRKALGARAQFYTMYGRTVHSKFIVVDDVWMTIGSANASERSFVLDSELNVSICEPALAKAFRTRLWAFNLGETEATVAGWAPADFHAKWRAVAQANRAASDVTDMAGAGIVAFDYTAHPGVESWLIPDALVQLDFDNDGGRKGPDERPDGALS